MSHANRHGYVFYLHFFLFSTLQGILCYALESFLNINTFLGRGLKVRDIPFRSTPCPCLFLWNLQITRSICLSTERKIETEGVLFDTLKAHTTLLFPPSTSTLFPRTTNGKFSGSEGLACKKFLKLLSQININ